MLAGKDEPASAATNPVRTAPGGRQQAVRANSASANCQPWAYQERDLECRVEQGIHLAVLCDASSESLDPV